MSRRVASSSFKLEAERVKQRLDRATETVNAARLRARQTIERCKAPLPSSTQFVHERSQARSSRDRPWLQSQSKQRSSVRPPPPSYSRPSTLERAIAREDRPRPWLMSQSPRPSTSSSQPSAARLQARQFIERCKAPLPVPSVRERVEARSCRDRPWTRPPVTRLRSTILVDDRGFRQGAINSPRHRTLLVPAKSALRQSAVEAKPAKKAVTWCEEAEVQPVSKWISVY
ncbi:hypothetical protein MMC20_005975 [Loxospora ochrophaea]|nr:hypothetical protein [Loxospora ochrophaea]